MKTPTVQNRALTVQAPILRGYITKKRQILRFDVQNLVHLQGLEPWAH